MWGDAKFRALSQDAKFLWLYLLTNNRTTSVPGLYQSGELEIAEALGWDAKRFRERFQELLRQGMAKSDWNARVVWVPNVVKYNPPRNENTVKGWVRHIDNVPECELKAEALQELKPLAERYWKQFGERFREPLRLCSATQDQDQDQDQEQDQKEEIDLSRSATVPETVPETVPATVTTERDDILSVFGHYRVYHPRAHKKPTSKQKEWRHVRDRLAEGYTVADLCEAIDGCHRSPYHQGANKDGRKYDSLELIMRDGSKVSAFLEMAKEPPAPKTEADLELRTAIHNTLNEPNPFALLGDYESDPFQ